MLLSTLAGLLCLAGPPERTVVIDDFTSGDLTRWESSTSPEYYRGGQGRQGLSLEADGGRPVLRAAFGFGNPAASEPIWITRNLDPPLLRLPIRRVSFRYRWELAEPAGLARAPLELNGFLIRLRTSPTEFTDFPVPRIDGGYPVGRWIGTVVDAGLLGSRVVNVYNALLSSAAEAAVIQLTFRLDDQDEVNARGALWLSDIRFDCEESAAEETYTPQPSPRTPDRRLGVLDIHVNGDGWYRFGAAARRLDASARVTTGPFRGLHFPIWEFPKSRAELLRYDVVVLGDVDPWVFTPEQTRWLADAVHSGVGLLVGSGPNSLGTAHRHPPAFLDLLPVTYRRGDGPISANAAPSSAGAHPLVAGLDPAALGTVRQVMQVTPKPGATLLLTAGGKPLLVAGQAGRGRVLLLNTWAQPAVGSFLMNAAWGPFAARLLAWLAGRELPPMPAAEAKPADKLRSARWRYDRSAFAPGSPFGIDLKLDGVEGEVTARMLGRRGEVWHANAPAAAEVHFDGTLPELRDGPLRVTVEWPGRPPREVLTGVVVDRLRRADFFPLISYLPVNGGDHWADEATVAALVDDVRAHGFNTIAMGGLGQYARGDLANQLRGVAERVAGASGMANILEYTDFTAYRRDKPWEVSPYDPAFREYLRQKLEPAVEQTRYSPRLLSVKFYDEPSMTPANLSGSEVERAAFERETGRPHVERKGVGDDPAARLAHARFVSACLERDFATGRKLKQEAKAPWDLCVTYDSGGYGSCRPIDYYQDPVRWTRQADRFDFDVYPYFYPASDRLRFVQANWCFAESRALSTYTGRPWGFYAELDDRNYPYQQNPVAATAECAWTAVTAGADYLNSFILVNHGTGSGCRPERWHQAGEALRAIRRLGPLLTRWHRGQAAAILVLPETQQIVHNGYAVPRYGLALLTLALGEADVVPESFLGGQGSWPGTAKLACLFGVRTLSRAAWTSVTDYVRQGGALLSDRLPETDEAGRKLESPDGWPTGFGAFGEGQVIRWDGDFEAQARGVVEDATPDVWRGLVATLRRDLGRAGVTPAIRVTANELQTDVGVRYGRDCAGVFVVNHQPEAQAVRLSLPWPCPGPGVVIDLATGRPVPGAMRADRTLRLEHRVPGRGAWAVGVYPALPKMLSLRVETPTVRPGETLRYSVAPERATGRRLTGNWLVELTVSDPAGVPITRLGGA
ncbi:MAG: hypothetical protein HYU66_17970, partial [Armatimonadetes bacterium]|nr:hypothetical protein [Armatimonadota bacterium]